MFKTLLKKQMMEINSWLLMDRKKGVPRTKGKQIMMIILYAVLYIFLGACIFGMAVGMCGPLNEIGLGWVYFVVMGTMAVLLGVFGSVFNINATIYKAKDNEMLLAMPIPPRLILTSRLLGVYMWSLIYVAIVFIPTIIAYGIYAKPGVLSIICCVLIMVFLSGFVLALSCILGWCVAKISAKMGNKSIVTTLLSLVVFAIYYYMVTQSSQLINELVSNAENVGKSLHGALPLYWMGRGCEGDLMGLVMTGVLSILIMAAIFAVMERSFFSMASIKGTGSRKAYKEKGFRNAGVSQALFRREINHLLSSSTYMLNCALGTVLMPAFGIFILIKKDSFNDLLGALAGSNSLIILAACGILCGISCMNDLTAPSISLEGKTIWLSRSLPVSGWDILKAKLKLHYMLTMIPMLVCIICMLIIVKPGLLGGLAMIALPLLFAAVDGAFGLMLDLKSPNFSWTNEAIPIKQSMTVFAALFTGWIVIGVLGVLFFLLHKVVDPFIFLWICVVIFAVLAFLLLSWLRKRGAALWEKL